MSPQRRPGTEAPVGTTLQEALRRGRQRGRRALGLMLALAFTYMAVEVLGGLFTGSLALLADAGHMLSDVVALGTAFLTSWYALRPPTPRRSYGYYRLEVLAALFNGVLLVLVAAYVVWEAYHRLQAPPQVRAGPMLAVAAGGLVVNLVGIAFLRGQSRESINVRGALFHVVGDALGSVGAISAGLVMAFTGWFPADPLISLFIAGLILFSAWRLVRATADILLESAPEGLDLEQVRQRVLALPGVRDVHDLHIWTVTTGFVAMSGHVVVENLEKAGGHEGLLKALRQRLQGEFGIEHTTVQLETRPPDEEHGCERLTSPRGGQC